MEAKIWVEKYWNQIKREKTKKQDKNNEGIKLNIVKQEKKGGGIRKQEVTVEYNGKNKTNEV
jgi:hypothetical protein